MHGSLSTQDIEQGASNFRPFWITQEERLCVVLSLWAKSPQRLAVPPRVLSASPQSTWEESINVPLRALMIPTLWYSAWSPPHLQTLHMLTHTNSHSLYLV